MTFNNFKATGFHTF